MAKTARSSKRDSGSFLNIQVKNSVKFRYFPELWYLIDNFFSTVRNKHLLEVGYGMGMIGEAFGKTGWRLTCIDQSVVSLASLKERMTSASISAIFEQSDLIKFPLSNQTFEAVICINTLEFQSRPTDTLREIFRVLQPGGRAAIVSFNRFSPWGFGAIARHVRDVSRNEHQYRSFAKFEFVKMLKMTGFTIVTVKDRAKYLPGSVNPTGLSLPVAGAFVALVTKPASDAKRERKS
jgi:ubiquinone/menaquinone biosynthesis C-methylase UbiE